MAVALPSLQQPAPGPPIAGRRPARWPRLADAVSLAYYVLAGASLAAAGVPVWRAATLVLPALAQQAQSWKLRRLQARRTCANVDPTWKARMAVLAQLRFFVATWIAVAVTGGIGSPLLVTVVSPYLAALLKVGDRLETRALLAATGLAACGLAAMPRAWTGPELAASMHAAVVALSVLGVGALLAPFDSATREMRDDLARAREEMASEALTRARYLEQVGTKVAHELKNPLSAVKALVQLVVRDTTQAAPQERLQVIEKEIARMQQILGEYLSFTRPLQEVRPEVVDLGPLVADALLVLSAHADQRRVRLNSQGMALVEADPRRLKEALMNLVANAIEATPPGGEVDVEVRRVSEAAEIVVRDAGVGMGPETLRRLGTPFFTTREEGTGLGIVLARSVVAQHGGSLLYESAPGKGTTATVKLPIHSPVRCRHAARAAR